MSAGTNIEVIDFASKARVRLSILSLAPSFVVIFIIALCRIVAASDNFMNIVMLTMAVIGFVAASLVFVRYDLSSKLIAHFAGVANEVSTFNKETLNCFFVSLIPAIVFLFNDSVVCGIATSFVGIIAFAIIIKTNLYFGCAPLAAAGFVFYETTVTLPNEKKIDIHIVSRETINSGDFVTLRTVEKSCYMRS